MEKNNKPHYLKYLRDQYGRSLKSYVDATRFIDVRVTDWFIWSLFAIVALALSIEQQVTEVIKRFILVILVFGVAYFIFIIAKDWLVLKKKGKVR